MRKQRTHFDKAFKENAVKLSLERKNISELAQELGIAPFLLYRWRKEYQQKGDASFPGHGVQSLSEDTKRIAELEKRLGEAETERDILKKSFEHHLQERSLIYLFIKEYNSKQWTVEVMCKVLKVPGSSYYRWLKDPESQCKRKYMELDEKIRDAYFAAKGRSGSPRLAKDLQVSGIPVSRAAVAFHMKEMGLRSKLKMREQMRLYVFEYIESWYNHKRRFSALGNLTIDEFWNQYNLKKESIKNVA